MPLDAGGVGGGGLSREQLRNAGIIYQVGRSLGASQRDIQIALITALTESRLINVNYGDRDSLGLFQQRAAWGSREARMDPVRSARMFFTGGAQGQRGLFDFKDRDQMGMGEAAQAVQVSAFPDRYATFLSTVRNSWNSVVKAGGGKPVDMDGNPYGTQPNQPAELDALTVEDSPTGFGALAAPTFDSLAAPTMDDSGATIQTFMNDETNQIVKDLIGQSGTPMKGVDGWRAGVIEEARKLVGTPYVWGGASADGVDCSGLLQYAFGQVGLDLPRVSYQQANFGKRVSLGALKPGDLVAWDNSSRNNGADHIALYIGNGQILEAPRAGLSVRIRDVGEGEGAWGVKLNF